MDHYSAHRMFFYWGDAKPLKRLAKDSFKGPMKPYSQKYLYRVKRALAMVNRRILDPSRATSTEVAITAMIEGIFKRIPKSARRHKHDPVLIDTIANRVVKELKIPKEFKKNFKKEICKFLNR